MKNFELPKRRSILLWLGTFIVTAFIYYIVTMRRTFVRHNGRIPYVWNQDFNETLRQYINTAPSRNVLVLTGPYQCGKSRALDIMSADLASARHLVLNVDLSTAHTPNDVVNLFKVAIINGLGAVYPYLSSSKINKVGDQFKTGDGDDTEEVSDRKNIDPLFGRVYFAFSRILDSSLNNSYSFIKFFDYLENVKTVLRPVLFIHDLDNLRTVAPSLYESTIARLSRRPLYEDFVPVVCEMKGSSFRQNDGTSDRNNNNYYYSQNNLAFKFVEVNELKDPTKDLVVKNRVFSALELRKIMAAFGGHGGTIDRVFEDLKAGLLIDESIEKQQNSVTSYIKRILKGNFPTVFYRICRTTNGTLAKITNTTELAELAPLLESGHLYMSKGSAVKMAHVGVKNAICGGYI